MVTPEINITQEWEPSIAELSTNNDQPGSHSDGDGDGDGERDGDKERDGLNDALSDILDVSETLLVTVDERDTDDEPVIVTL